MDSPGYVAGEVTLEAGDWLATFIDGVVEAENRLEQQYSEERLMTMLRWGAQLPPQSLLGSIMMDIDRFVDNAPQHDDITCMLMKATAQPVAGSL